MIKKNMKLIIGFVIGLLIGAVMATGVFFIYSKANGTNYNSKIPQMNNGFPPEMPNKDDAEFREIPDIKGNRPSMNPNSDSNPNNEFNGKDKENNDEGLDKG